MPLTQTYLSNMKRGECVTGLIDAAHAKKVAEDKYEPSGSIGASVIGNTCDAFLALTARGFKGGEWITPKLNRIFRDGHRIERSVLDDLRIAGVRVMENDPMTGKQWTWRSPGGAMVFKADGLLTINEDMLLEIKSMNDASWTKFKNSPVRFSHPHYYDQMQQGMGMSGIHKCLFVSYNKNNSLYWDEIVEYDDIRYHYLLGRVQNAVQGTVEKVSKSETDWRCRDCAMSKYCWKGEAPAKRKTSTCANAKYDGGAKGFVCGIGYGTCDPDSCKDYKQWQPKDRT